ncbi:MAG: YciI family protein [Devosia sp.]
MRYLCLVHMAPDAFSGLSESDQRQLDRDSLAYDQELQAAGHYVASDALEGPQSAVMVKVRGGDISVTDGPFSETKEHLGGFILIEARDMNEAIRLAAGIPIAKYSTIEVRPVYLIPDPERP